MQASPMYPDTTGGNPGVDRLDLGKQFLLDKDWTPGMADTMMKNLDHVAYRFMIIDDSGSMSIFDGNLYMQAPNGKGKMVKASRWQELVQAIDFHAEFADIAQAPTEFRFLNSSGPIVVGDSADDDGRARAHLTKILSGGPSGGTPLCKQVTEIANKVRMMAPELKQRGQLASVTIFTDGQASDGDMARALKQLEHLPVWTVIRLCTDEDDVGDYWSGIDENIELQMDVLDDLAGEAREVKMCNPCVTYCEQLHRLRENGARIKVFDFLDEKRLFPAELRTLMSVVIGGKEEDYTHPDVDIDSFVQDCSAAIQRTKMVYDPFRKQLKYIIDPKLLKAQAGKGGCCTIA